MPDSAIEPCPAAGVWRRLAAMLYDSFLLFGVLFIATVIAAAVTGNMDFQTTHATDEVVHEIPPALQGLAFRLYLLAVIGGFYSIFWRRSGQTLGMQAWRIRVQDAQGRVPSWRQCLLRLLVAIPSLLLGGLGYWWIWLDREGRAWHDRASGTQVVQLPKKK